MNATAACESRCEASMRGHDSVRQAKIRGLAMRRVRIRAAGPPSRRTIQRLVENELSRMVLAGTARRGDLVTVDADGDRLTFDVRRGSAHKAADAKEQAAEPEPAHQV